MFINLFPWKRTGAVVLGMSSNVRPGMLCFALLAAG